MNVEIVIAVRFVFQFSEIDRLIEPVYVEGRRGRGGQRRRGRR
jgi:hypothetical protein